MWIGQSYLTSYGVCLLVVGWLVRVTEGQNLTYVGYNVTGTVNNMPGDRSVLMSDIVLPTGWLIGFLVTTSGNCSVYLQLWTRNTGSLQDHTLNYTTFEQTFNTAGQQQVDLGVGNAIYLTGTETLGFTAATASECVAFDFVINPLSTTMTYPLGAVPTVGNTYTFTPYQVTSHYGLMAIIQDTEPQTISYFGFNASGTEVLQSQTTLFAILLRDVGLSFGRLVAFHAHIFGADCQLYFQLWKLVNATTLEYGLTYMTAMHNLTGSGYYRLPVPDPVVVYSSNRFAVLDASPTPCVLFEFTPIPSRFSPTSYHNFQSGLPSVGQQEVFRHFQVTYRFSVMVEIDGVIPPAVTGLTGDIGPTGNTGPDGATGLPGVTGVMGIAGLVAETGPVGAVGGQGAVGMTGPVGLTGPRGDVGTVGPQGATGLDGDNGIPGNTGSVGQQGYTGIQGPTGHPGNLGTTGQAGTRGDGGKEGPAGASIVGLQGTRGTKGVPGERGSRGPLGAVGITGMRGSMGVIGPMWDPSDINFCAIHAASCEHGCTSSHLGYTCTCRPGYNLLGNSNCPDIDECSQENGRCQFYCLNTVGSYVCSCPQGYQLSNDRHRCDDINECLVNNGDCASGQLCINTWDGRVCAGPYSYSAAIVGKNTVDKAHLVTASMFVGIFIWLSVVTFIMIMEVILLIPSLNRRQPGKEKSPPPPKVVEDIAQEYYFPTFFPRVRLGERDYHNTGSARSLSRSDQTYEKQVRL